MSAPTHTHLIHTQVSYVHRDLKNELPCPPLPLLKCPVEFSGSGEFLVSVPIYVQFLFSFRSALPPLINILFEFFFLVGFLF